MPLRAKPGQSTITCIVGGTSPVAAERGRRRARDVAAYYAGAQPRPDIPLAPAAAPGIRASEARRRSRAGATAAAYFGEAAHAAAGGSWCLARNAESSGPLPSSTVRQLEQLGVLPWQDWTEERLEALL